MKKLQVLLACGVAALIGSTTAHAAEKTYSIGADLELDLTQQNGNLGESGRVKLNATGVAKNDNGYFVKGVGQILVPLDGDVGYDDVYLQAGRDSLNFQIGHFEGVSGFSKGKDTLVVHAGSVSTYEANKSRGRFKSGTATHAAINGGAGAVSYQLGLVNGNNNDVEGYRPAVSFKLGGASLTAIYDVYEDGTNDWKGFGLTASVPMGGGTLGAGYAAGENNNVDISSASVNYTKGSWGLGYIHAEDDITAVGASVDTFYGAYTMPLFGIKDASVTLAASTSKADGVTGDDSENAARVRFNYTF